MHFQGFSVTVHIASSRRLQHFASFLHCEKSFWQIPLSTWEDIVHLSSCCFQDIQRFFQKYSSTFSKVFQDILNMPKHSKILQDIVYLSRMVLPGLKYFSETGWPWSSTAVSSGTARYQFSIQHLQDI